MKLKEAFKNLGPMLNYSLSATLYDKKEDAEKVATHLQNEDNKVGGQWTYTVIPAGIGLKKFAIEIKDEDGYRVALWSTPQ